MTYRQLATQHEFSVGKVYKICNLKSVGCICILH